MFKENYSLKSVSTVTLTNNNDDEDDDDYKYGMTLFFELNKDWIDFRHFKGVADGDSYYKPMSAIKSAFSS